MKTVYDLYPDIDHQRDRRFYGDIVDDFFWQVFDQTKPYSLLSVEAFYNLFRSVEYIARNHVPGDIVECGVFLGGAVLAMSQFAAHFGLRDRAFYLYDTFVGFPQGSEDTDIQGKVIRFGRHLDFLPLVREVIAQSSYPQDRFQFIAGPVEETLPARKPDQIALLRLDTDYYQSTRVELNELYPRLTPGGVLIVDDYGHFKGVRRAADEYFERQTSKVMLFRVNYTVRAGVKPPSP